MSDYRTEKDSMGEVRVAADALYGAQTQRAIDNFRISGEPLPADFIRALALQKKCAARANQELGELDEALADVIAAAADAIIDGKHADQFPIDIFQTGSGTSTNMNMNEVLANLASRSLGKPVSPNDHVNLGQSSNDSIPTAIHLSAALNIHIDLLPALHHLCDRLDARAADCAEYVKTGRTHLMDAMPITLGQEISTWADQIRAAIRRLGESLQRLQQLPQGGTAVGTGINAHRKFAATFCAHLSESTGLAFRPMDNPFTGIASQDTAVEVSGQLKTLAVSLMKIANDLRWMNSGPLSGIGEIELPALQPGSSIMPGKVNPVIPEAVAMVSAQVIGNDSAITVAGQSGNFQLNVMLPLVADRLLSSIRLLANGSRALADLVIRDFSVREANLTASLSRNPILVTALNPVIGYMKAAEIAKQAYREQRPVIEVALEKTDLSREELEDLLDPAKLAHPHRKEDEE